MADPNAADWLTAVGTVGTLGFTVVLFWTDRSQRKRRERRAQAVLISGWADGVKAKDKERDVYVANMSDEPVYNVNVFLQDEENADKEKSIAQPQISGNKRLINNRFVSVLPPKQRVALKVKRENPESAGPRTLPLVALLFDDKNNTRWLRNWDGKVTLAGEKERDHNVHRATNPSDNIEPLKRESIG